MNFSFKNIFYFLLIFSTFSLVSCKKSDDFRKIQKFEKCYPDISFYNEYDKNLKDYKISVTINEQNSKEFYWCDGKFLPIEELENQEKYWTLIYKYPKVLYDPKDLTDEQKQKLKEFSSSQNRKSGSGTPPFFFDFIYQADSRGSLEQNLVRTTFLGKSTTVHKRILNPLKNVEKELLEVSKTDSDVENFIKGLKSTDSYYWRIIKGTNRKSFHSYGIALDVLPYWLQGKQVFWSWAQDIYGEDWMLVPLENRWIPPEKVIEIFEANGFIWGGKWIIWDNMHFEYHPELIAFQDE